MENDLDSPGGRLRWARERANYRDAADFAKAVGVKPVTYRAHEGNQNGFARQADRYAEKLDVEPSWLLYGGEVPAPAATLSAKVLARLLYSLGPSLPKGDLSESAAGALAAALIHGIELLPPTGANDASEDAIGVAARAAVLRFREALNS